MNQRLIAEIGRTQRLQIINSLKRTRGLSVNELVEKMGGKPLVTLSFTVSADGKTLTETGGAVGISEKFKAVYDRQ